MSKQKNLVILWLNEGLEQLIVRLFPIKAFIVFLTTAFTIAISLLLAFYLRFEFQFPVKEILSLERVLPIAVLVKLVVFYLFHIYSGMWRYVSIYDLLKIFFANLVSSLILSVIIISWQQEYFAGFSRSVLILDFLICFSAISGKRVLTRIIRETASLRKEYDAVRTLVLGSSCAANSLIHSFSTTPGRKILGILNNELSPGITIRGIPVMGNIKNAGHLAKSLNISEILLLPPYSTPGTIRQIMDQLEQENTNCTLRMLPTYTDIADGNIDFSHIKKVEIDDLLGRKPVKLDRTEVAEFVNARNIMVTGAGGSIGAELCRQIASYKPGCLVLFELSEFNLYEISRKLQNSFPEVRLVNIIGDVRSENDVLKALAQNKIELVYHAAAYKHVPLMEENTAMCFSTNVFGSASVVSACEKAGVSRMVLVSTDKAVCPSSMMGASKRIAERIVLEREKSPTQFVVVRFGNVLGSSGSVIPLFKQQIEEGGPVTVTSKNVVRYFMSIPEAVDLVLQASVIGHDRDIMVLEMGEQIKIYDMAKKLIELSGLVPEKDIEIKIIGMRPGEKEYEELLTDEEKVQRTPFDRIYVARKQETTLPPVNLDRIKGYSEKDSLDDLKSILKEYIPENKFNNVSL